MLWATTHRFQAAHNHQDNVLAIKIHPMVVFDLSPEINHLRITHKEQLILLCWTTHHRHSKSPKRSQTNHYSEPGNAPDLAAEQSSTCATKKLLRNKANETRNVSDFYCSVWSPSDKADLDEFNAQINTIYNSVLETNPNFTFDSVKDTSSGNMDFSLYVPFLLFLSYDIFFHLTVKTGLHNPLLNFAIQF